MGGHQKKSSFRSGLRVNKKDKEWFDCNNVTYLKEYTHPDKGWICIQTFKGCKLPTEGHN